MLSILVANPFLGCPAASPSACNEPKASLYQDKAFPAGTASSFAIIVKGQS